MKLVNDDLMDVPQQLENIDITALKRLCQEHIDDFNTGNEDDDDEHYIYEAAMEAVFGKNVWKWINSRVNSR